MLYLLQVSGRLGYDWCRNVNEEHHLKPVRIQTFRSPHTCGRQDWTSIFNDTDSQRCFFVSAISSFLRLIITQIVLKDKILESSVLLEVLEYIKNGARVQDVSFCLLHVLSIFIKYFREPQKMNKTHLNANISPPAFYDHIRIRQHVQIKWHFNFWKSLHQIQPPRNL